MYKLQEIYDRRAENTLNNFILWIRWEYYKYFIIPFIREFIKKYSWDWKGFLYWKIVERWSWQWHKMLKTIEWLLGDWFEFFWIEPSKWMREIAEKKFKNDNRVSFIDWFAENLPFKNESIDFIFDIQMQHHHTREKRQEMIKEALRVLKKWWHICILDTFSPFEETLLSWVKKRVFSLLQWLYINKVGKWDYYNGTLEETIDLLEEEWFYINTEYSRWYKVFLWHILWIDFINMIIATKN